jgi:hypothetical protein
MERHPRKFNTSKPKQNRKPFTKDEDERIKKWVVEKGENKWGGLDTILERSQKAVRDHYNQKLKNPTPSD